MGRRFLLSSLTLSVLFVQTSIFTEERLPDPTKPAPVADSPVGAPLMLDEVIVTATRANSEVKELPQSVNVVTSNRIERLQSRQPNIMLKEQAGVWSVNVAAQGSPIIRGQIGNRLLYLWDGVRINNGALFGGPNGFFNQFPVGAVDRIEVIRGAGSVQYGSDAIGGVINVMSKKGLFTESRKYGGEVYGRYGTNDKEGTETLDVYLSDKKYAFAGGITNQNVSSYRGPDEGRLNPSGFDALGGYANIAYRPVENHTLRLSWIQNRRNDVESYVQSKLNVPSGVPRIFSPTERRGIVKLDYTAEDLGPLSKEFKFYAYDQYYDAKRDRRVESTATFNNTRTFTHQDIFGVGAQNITPIDKHRFIYGVDYRFEDQATNNELKSRNKASQALTRSHPAGNTPDGTYDVFDVFGTGEFRPIDDLLVTAGVRYENSHINTDPEARDVIPNAGYSLNTLDLDKSWQSVVWNVGTVYSVLKRLDLTASVSSGFRAPTYSDLLSAGAPVFASKIASIPSPDLDPETSITYEFGPRYHDKRLTATLAAYWTQLDDVIVNTDAGTVEIPGQGTFNARGKSNDGKGYVRGLEFAFSYIPAKNWNIFGNATYTYGQDTVTDVPLRFMPPLNGVFGLRYEDAKGKFWAEIVEVWSDRLKRHAPDDELDAGFSRDPGLGSPNTTTNKPLRSDFELPGWAITNVRGGVNVWKDRVRSFDITVDLNNVFNTRYREAYSQQQLVAPGFGAVIGGRLRF